jgi:hypothetical protein
VVQGTDVGEEPEENTADESSEAAKETHHS